MPARLTITSDQIADHNTPPPRASPASPAAPPMAITAVMSRPAVIRNVMTAPLAPAVMRPMLANRPSSDRPPPTPSTPAANPTTRPAGRAVAWPSDARLRPVVRRTAPSIARAGGSRRSTEVRSAARSVSAIGRGPGRGTGSGFRCSVAAAVVFVVALAVLSVVVDVVEVFDHRSRLADSRRDAKERLLELGGGLEPLLLIGRHRLQQDVFRLGRHAHAARPRRDELVVGHARRRLGRRIAGDRAIDRRGHRIDVGPRPLTAFAQILLERRIAGFEDHRQALAPIAERVARRAEVEQLHLLRLRDVDVVRTDVAVQQAAFVHDAQRVEHRHDDRDGLVIGDRPLQLQIFHERQAVEVLHDEIARAMFAEEAQHRRDAGMIVEAHDGAALFEELGQPVSNSSRDSPPYGVTVTPSEPRVATSPGRYSFTATFICRSGSQAR